MKPSLKVSEMNKACDIMPRPALLNELKITNVSAGFIRDLQLIIHDTSPILTQAVIRERGSLSFDPHTTLLELGNLAPEESAYFEYKFESPHHIPSMVQHFSLIYTEVQENGDIEKKVVELASSPTTS